MRWLLAGVAAGVLVLTACGSDMARSQVRTVSGWGVRDLPCSEFIGTQAPERGMRVIPAAVELPASPRMQRALQTVRLRLRDPAARLFAASGLVIRPGGRFRFSVPDRLRRKLSIGWDSGCGSA